jgi:uncharacterized protein YfaS (alpha-2-macroglobulin family)
VIEVQLGNRFRRQITIPAKEAEVMKEIDLSRELKQGDQRIQVSEGAESGGAGYQVLFRYHLDRNAPPKATRAFDVTFSLDKNEVTSGELLNAKVIFENIRDTDAPMVMLEVPVPPSCVTILDDFARMLANQKLDKYELHSGHVVLYLRGLKAKEKFELNYRLRTTSSAKVTVPAAKVYEYYDPDQRGISAPTTLTIR